MPLGPLSEERPNIFKSFERYMVITKKLERPKRLRVTGETIPSETIPKEASFLRGILRL